MLIECVIRERRTVILKIFLINNEYCITCDLNIFQSAMKFEETTDEIARQFVYSIWYLDRHMRFSLVKEMFTLVYHLAYRFSNYYDRLWFNLSVLFKVKFYFGDDAIMGLKSKIKRFFGDVSTRSCSVNMLQNYNCHHFGSQNFNWYGKMKWIHFPTNILYFWDLGTLCVSFREKVSNKKNSQKLT